MEEPNSDEWLPPGWTVDVRVRKNGKRDKYYFPPSSGLKFNSKVEVFRYLDNAQNKVRVQKISPNVVVEKAIAEGLPPGWVKKTRITTKRDTVRRDSYYIDPVSGYTFRSIKDVDRYLESGEIGRKALKPKDKDGSDMELKADKSHVWVTGVLKLKKGIVNATKISTYTKPMVSSQSTSVTMKKTLSVSMGQSSALDMIANDQQIPRPASSGEYMSVPMSACVVGSELTSSDQKEGKVGWTDEDAQEKQLQENSETKHETEKAQGKDRQCKKKHKKEINFPRRASKRLAGIKVDPVPELKTRNRARHVAVKQSCEEDTVTNMDKSPNSLLDGLAKQFNSPEGGSEIKCKSEEVQRSDKDKECFSFSPLENNAKLDYTLDFPLRELLTDPCIAFAVQTLTGVTFETTKNSQTCSELKGGEGHGKKSNDGLGDNVFSPPQEHAGDAKTDDKAKNENAGTFSEKTCDMSWMDPCIEFAIKTLTGTIPVDSDQNPKNCLQQQLSSSNKQHSEMALSSVSLDNKYQTDYYCSQYFGTQKPMFKQTFENPSLQHTRNIALGNSASAGARLSHCGEDTRRNKFV
ncbi:Methyl-CpG-binding domain-containing protein 13, partial [Mucuna pruriens]